MTSDRNDFIAALRHFATFLESHPTLRAPGTGKFYVFAANREEMVEHAQVKTSWVKRYNDSYFELSKKFGPLEYEISIPREQVCRKVENGTKTVAAVPAREAIPEHEEPVIEWVCDELSLLGGK